jgi:hypothetical protein
MISMLKKIEVDQQQLVKILKSEYYRHINYLINEQ